jgi:hypothetical protein
MASSELSREVLRIEGQHLKPAAGEAVAYHARIGRGTVASIGAGATP